MPVLVEQDDSRAVAMAGVLPDGAHAVTTVERLYAWLDNHPDEYVVVLGPAVPMHTAADVAARMRGSHPSAGIVLIRPNLTTEIFSSAMSVGIPAVVGNGDGASLQSAVERARQTWEAIHGPSSAAGGAGARVITVFSPKGGVGKTTMAVNLAIGLSAGGARRVCLVDLDLAFGDVAITLQLIPEHTIEEAVSAELSLDFALLQQLLTRHSDHLMVLAAPTTPDAKDRIPASFVRRAIATLRRHFDYLVIDTSPGFDESVLQALDETDELVLTATLDVPTVKNMKMALETLDLLDLAKGHRHLVINRADDEVGLSVKDVERILKQPVEAAIPTDIAVATATNHGRPILLAKPDHRVSQSIRAFASLLSGDPVVPAAGARRAAPRRGLVRRGRRKES